MYEAKIISVEIKQVDGINQIILTVEAEYGNNVQALLYNPAGDFSVPLPDDFVSIMKIPGSGAYIAIGNLNSIQDVEKGEKYLYSRDANGTEKASIYLDNTGKLTIETDGEININGGAAIKLDGTTDIELNGNNKKFVTYAELNQALQTFLIALNAHTHAFTGTGSVQAPSSPMMLDISASETTTVKTGG